MRKFAGLTIPMATNVESSKVECAIDEPSNHTYFVIYRPDIMQKMMTLSFALTMCNLPVSNSCIYSCIEAHCDVYALLCQKAGQQ